jgi:hypothetical protein
MLGYHEVLTDGSSGPPPGDSRPKKPQSKFLMCPGDPWQALKGIFVFYRPKYVSEVEKLRPKIVQPPGAAGRRCGGDRGARG